jgi:hypothetical protein
MARDIRGAETRWRVFSGSQHVSLQWWATSATQERYLTCVFGLETMDLAMLKANCSVLI